MRSLQAIILAAGEGTRMKSELPKVLHPICGRPMIAYTLDLAAAAGVKQPIVVLGRGAEQVKAVLPKEAKAVIQTARVGTGDAVTAAKKSLGTGAVLILYADTPLLRRTTVQKLIETHFKTGSTCTLLTAHLADPSGYGRVVRNENGQITEVVEEAEAASGQRAIREINVGPLVCDTAALIAALATVKPSRAKHELYLTDIISHLARQEGTKIQASRVEEVSEALGINSRVELARAIGVIRQRIVEQHMNNGVTIELPASTFIDQGVSIGADTTIRPYTVIETGVSIGKRCTIGPFARLRRGVAIADDVRVGNFTELVRTKVGARTRIGHVSYLGDATVEDDVNIGAGTITANYDGKEKHPTHIGKGALIGSDTVLIAPVKVGAGAVTGAGSVIPKAHDVPAKGVVVGVPARALQVAGTAGGPARPMDHREAKGARPAAPVKAVAATKVDGHPKPAVRRPSARAKAARAGVRVRVKRRTPPRVRVSARRRAPAARGGKRTRPVLAAARRHGGKRPAARRGRR